MIVTIKPHSSLRKFFSESEYRADFSNYYDLMFYLNALHPKFTNYLRQQKEIGLQEGYVLLDKKLKEINPEELKFRHAKDGDIIHIVPAIFGGGGKRGGLLSALALAAFIFVLPAVGVGMAAGSAGAGLGASIAAGVGSIGTAGSFAGGLAMLKASPFLMNIVVNVGLAILANLFAPKPKEETNRQNDMFGSLSNTTGSGIPIALNYGQVRVAGQLISGYVLSVNHGKSQTLNTYGRLLPFDVETPSSEQEQETSRILQGFNQYV